MAKNLKRRASQGKFKDLSGLEEFPAILPTCQTFSEAVAHLQDPLRLIRDLIDPFDFSHPVLPLIKEVIGNYMEQFDYVFNHAKLRGQWIGWAKIEHDFRIEDL